MSMTEVSEDEGFEPAIGDDVAFDSERDGPSTGLSGF